MEPMNAEMIQELLASVDPAKNELETFLNKPFTPNVEIGGYDRSMSRDDVGYRDSDLDRSWLPRNSVSVAVDQETITYILSFADK